MVLFSLNGGGEWTTVELRTTLADYFAMLTKELGVSRTPKQNIEMDCSGLFSVSRSNREEASLDGLFASRR